MYKKQKTESVSILLFILFIKPDNLVTSEVQINGNSAQNGLKKKCPKKPVNTSSTFCFFPDTDVNPPPEPRNPHCHSQCTPKEAHSHSSTP
ncbi:hypothetical protein KC19_4G143100 [Ceratodon purpureus]|uniref:Uncharacterized protein n=1 Tax=Ceratodon purpureus TaxID=3225 RepID=A0A8T0IC81_CERPU|nr:hypothetical protein KC19_4G143100 [Ceratodon purpureus]